MQIVLIDKTNHHLFQPLLYQVATAALSPADIAAPIRSIFHRCPTVSIVLDEVTAVNPQRREVLCRHSGAIGYDFLVLAPGSCPNYFGHDHWRQFAPPLKTLKDALELRRRILEAYELAASCPDPEEARAYTTFVVIGGGPTGVELAGALAEIGRFTMTRDFPQLNPEDIRVVLLEAGPRLLPSFPPKLSARALRDLTELGVNVCLGVRATDIQPTGVLLSTGEFLAARTVIWAAGTQAPDFLRSLGVPLDRSGRVIVAEDCSVPGFPEIFVIGDASCFRDPRFGELPALAPVALQQGRFVARLLCARRPPARRPHFRYRHRGILATIGRARAVAALPPNLHFGGFLAWLLWAAVHIVTLIRFRNRFAVLSEWLWYYLTYQPGARLLIEPSSTPPGHSPTAPS
jgi:NADH dehydrogenase